MTTTAIPMTTTAPEAETTDERAARFALTVRERRFVAALLAGRTNDAALAAAGYHCAPGASASAMARKLRSRLRVRAALGDVASPRERQARACVLTLLPERDRETLMLALDVALAAVAAGQRAPHGGPALTQFEAHLVGDLRAQLVALDAPAEADGPTTSTKPEAGPGDLEPASAAGTLATRADTPGIDHGPGQAPRDGSGC